MPRQMLPKGQPKRRSLPKLPAPFHSSARRSNVRYVWTHGIAWVLLCQSVMLFIIYVVAKEVARCRSWCLIQISRVITVGQGCSKWGVRYDRIPHVTCMQWWYEEFYILIIPYNFWMKKTFYTLTNRTLIRHILLPNGFFHIWGWRAPQTWENSFPGWHWLCRGLNERDQEQINYIYEHTIYDICEHKIYLTHIQL